MRGEWVSIAPELRPSTIKNADGAVKPFYLTRTFRYQLDDEFQLTILNLADPYEGISSGKGTIQSSREHKK